MQAWLGELWRLAGLVFLSLLFGMAIDHIPIGLLVGLSGYIIWHLANLRRLDRWLASGRKLQPLAAWGLWGDVFSKIHRLQQSSRKRKRRLKKILNAFQESTAAMPDAGIVLGPGGDILWWNDAASTLLQLRSPRDVGLRIDNLLRHPRFLKYFSGDLESDDVEIPSPLDDDVILNLRAVRYGRDQRLLVIRDVSQVYRLERIRRDFVANVSHELRTPLTVIRGYLETLGDTDNLAVDRRKALYRVMEQQAQRMERLLEDLLLLSRMEVEDETPPMAPVAVPQMLRELREEALALSVGRHRIDLETDNTLDMRGLASELRSAFGNLLTNAVIYTPEGGSIALRWWSDQEGICFEVRDTGPGIDPKHIPRLTERFYRVDASRSRATGGTGLGLAIVKHVLERHRGKLEVESEHGKGSVFRCRFPAALAITAGASQRPD